MHCEQTTKQIVGDVEEYQNQSSAQDDGELHRHRPQIERMSDSKELRFPDLETVPNLGTKGYHCKELPVPRG